MSAAHEGTTLACRGACAGIFSIILFLASLAAIPLRFTTLLWLCALLEVAFAVHYVLLCKELYPRSSYAHLPEGYDPEATKQKLVRHLKRVDNIKESMKSWFINAQHWNEIKRRNLKELFAYAIWYKTIEQLQAEGDEHQLDDLIVQLERNAGEKVPEGYNPHLKFMSHLWDPVRHIYRPLVFYMVMELLAWLCHIVLIAAGFKLQELGGISYYTLNMGPQQLVQTISESLSYKLKQQPQLSSTADRATADADAAELPIVFLHGVGAGLLPYLALVFHFATLGRPMILPESKHVSMRLVRWLPTVEDMADGTAAIMAAHGVEKAVVVAHSYGTMVAARLVLKYEGLVHSLCLMDPVCFAMFMPDLIRNFLYTRHNSGCIVIDVIMALVSTELHCTRSFSRNFFWTNINLWDEHIPPRTLVVLSGRDILAPTNQVHTWLREHTHAQVLYKPDMPHAGVLVNLNWQATVIEAFKQVVERAPGSPAAAAAVAAAEGPDDSAAEVAAAAEDAAEDAVRCEGMQEDSAAEVAAAADNAMQAAAMQEDSSAVLCNSGRSFAGVLQDSVTSLHGRPLCNDVTADVQENYAASASASDAETGGGCESSSDDTDDTAWEARHSPGSMPSSCCMPPDSANCAERSCNCLNCQLSPFPGASSLDALGSCCHAAVPVASISGTIVGDALGNNCHKWQAQRQHAPHGAVSTAAGPAVTAAAAATATTMAATLITTAGATSAGMVTLNKCTEGVAQQ